MVKQHKQIFAIDRQIVDGCLNAWMVGWMEETGQTWKTRMKSQQISQSRTIVIFLN